MSLAFVSNYLCPYCAELFKMVCEANETDVDIGIPTVMLPQDAGENLENHLLNNSVGMFLFFLCAYSFVMSYSLPLPDKSFN